MIQVDQTSVSAFSELPLSKPIKSPENKKEFHLDRSVLFMKRLEDEGGIVHMNHHDREMIDMIVAKEK